MGGRVPVPGGGVRPDHPQQRPPGAPAGCWRAGRAGVLAGRPGAAHARLVALLDRPGLEEYDVTALLPVLAWAHLEMGDTAKAGEVVEQALRRHGAEGLRLVLVEALRVQAMVAAHQEQWGEMEQALEEGIALARSMPYPYAEARLLHLSGRLQAEVGKPQASRERLMTALAIFQRLGARKRSEEIERDLASLPQIPVPESCRIGLGLPTSGCSLPRQLPCSVLYRLRSVDVDKCVVAAGRFGGKR